MNCRYRWFTITAVPCQLVFAFLLLTNGLRLQAQDLPVLPMYYGLNTFRVKPYVKDLQWRRVANERFLQKAWIAEH